MYSILAALVAAALAFTAVAIAMGPLAGVMPAIIVFGIVIVLLLRRASTHVQAMMAPMQELLQAGKPDEVDDLLLDIQRKWAVWMPMLSGQLDAQRGMLDYVRLKWDDALPKLQSGKWRNWVAQGCIACIHYRKGDKDKAFEMFAKASKTGKKEPLAWILRGVMLNKDGRRDEALAALGEGLVAIPNNKQISELHKRIANKKRIDTARFGQGWYQFFPDELAKRMKAQQNNSPFGAGFRGPRSSKAQRRGR